MIVDLTVMFAKEKPTWGYDRISGALSNIGYHICDSTIGNILKAHGIEPAPDHKRIGFWETFLKTHWEVMAAIEFITVEVSTRGGLTTFHLLFVVELKTRRVNFACFNIHPNDAWMKTIALQLTNDENGILKDKQYLIMDRNATFSKSFRTCLRRESVKPLRLPARSPNLNAYLERFFGSLKFEWLHKLILFGEASTRKAVRDFVTHYHTERNHQGLKNELIVAMDGSPEIETTERLGDLLRSYWRVA